MKQILVVCWVSLSMLVLVSCGGDETTVLVTETIAPEMSCSEGQEFVYSGTGWECVDKNTYSGNCISSVYGGGSGALSSPVSSLEVKINEAISPSWLDVCGGEVVFVENPDPLFQGSNAEFSDVVLFGQPAIEDGVSISLVAANSFRVDLTEKAQSISISPFVIPKVVPDVGRNWQYNVYQPGQPQPVTIDLEAAQETGDDRLRSWWIDTYNGQEVRKTIMIEGLDAAGNSIVSYGFSDCTPVGYNEFPGWEIISLTCRVSGIDTGRSEVNQWIEDMLQPAPDSGMYRDLTIDYFDEMGTVLSSRTYMECFLAGYSFPQFDKASTSLVNDSITVVPGYYDF